MTTQTSIYVLAGLGLAIVISFRLLSLKKYLERADARFIAQATDDSQRRVAIEHLSELRQRDYQLAIILTIGLLATSIFDLLNPTALGAIGAIGVGLGTVIGWVKTMKSTSDLRLLKLVDRLRQ